MRFYLSFVVMFFCFCGVSLTENQNGGFSVKLIGPDSSPFYNTANTDQFQKVSNMVKHSINRVRYLNHEFSFCRNNRRPQTTVTPFMGVGYTMSYSIGTPPFQLYGIIDTGSDFSWFQCKPCKPCFNQTSPMFDPSKSSTYKTISCSSPTCKHVEPRNCSFDHGKNKCEYSNLYADNSYSQGDVSVDTLTLNSSDGSSISFPRFVIGCGHKTKLSTEGNLSGIIGLGRGSLSLISQLSSSIGGKFSYCFVPLFSMDNNISSKLNFGDKAVVSGPGTVSTPMAQIFSNITYSVTLEAFSVVDHYIEVENNSLTFGKQGNTIIDSGSTLTSVSKHVYSRLESAVATTMVKLKRVKDPTKQLNLCYKTTLNMLEVPIITAHFSGGDVKLNALNTFIQVDHEVVCFAFIGIPVGVIFGNVAQQNFLVGFDNVNNIVSFKPTDCTKL